ncbi:glycosyltransferase family 2 protein [Microbacterium terricola]|uniref:4,4'-diaponeurosporenoate glycosyltransferase n=1 Tax=Microbacterium terricola TaxID=344163 RepID=A0ABM8E056_9MICO|nr:glycosyltransferase family 2 protein [Microbacterium terricola]UYK41014.1 glycosyltransferase family 2 protein [Microbacterium terricola]BDV31229.1 glycosyl hydrolase [Microbacterium terricola]
MPALSVVIPSYNDAAMLRSCLDALAVQTRAVDEIVVVDNGSTDATAAVARAAGARVVTESIRGVLPATAAGFDAARGDLLARLDADSVPPPDWAARVVAAFEDDRGLDALSGPGAFYGGSPLTHWVAEHLYIGAYRVVVGGIMGHPVLYGSNLALRADTWRDVRTRVHRTMADVHDDFDICMNLEPGTNIRFDMDLVVGVSARPFATFAGFGRRVRVGLSTLALNAREESLISRRSAWRRAARGPQLEPDVSTSS